MQFLNIPAPADQFLQGIHITGIQMFCLPGNTVLLDSPAVSYTHLTLPTKLEV